MPRSNKTLKAITTEAKAIRKNKPSITWQNAIKQASKFYNDTIKPTAKKVAKTSKRVYSATKKGYAVAKRSYAQSKISGKIIDLKTIKTGQSFNYKPAFITYEIYRISPNKFEITDTSSGWYTAIVDKKTMQNLLDNKIDFINLDWLGAVSIKTARAGTRSVKTGSGRLGMGLTKKKVKNIPTLQKFIKTGVPANKGAKPKKPSLTDLKKANIEFFEGYRKLGVKEQKVFYSPILNKYFLIQKIDPSKFKNNSTMLYKNIQYYAFIINPKSNKVASMPDYVARSIEQINAKFLTQIID
jgi:hypothetical protein